MSWGLDPIYDSLPIGLFLVTGIAAMLFAVLPPGVSGQRRRTLLLLRAAAAVALALVLLRPSLIREDNRPAAATLAIAIDTSASMELPSGDSENRWTQQKRVVDRLVDQLAGNDESLRVALIGFDEAAELIDGINTNAPDGRGSDLTTPLELAMNTGRSSPLTGIALLSDGTQVLSRMGDEPSSSATSPRSDPQRAARMVGAMGVPIWTVPLGPPGEASRQIDLAVRALPETFRMFAGNESVVTFEVVLNGVANSPAEVRLQWIDDAGQTSIAATRSVTAESMQQTIGMSIPISSPKVGRYRLVAGVETRVGESVTDNNSQVAFVDVREGGGRVLYLEGTPRLEQKELRWALGRFLDLDLTYRWIPRDSFPSWPIDLGDDFTAGRYDVVIVGDLHSAALGDAQWRQLADAVAKGTALITLGGEHTYSRGGYASSALAEVLPVKLDDRLTIPPGPLDMSSNSSSGAAAEQRPIVLKPSASHPITTVDVRDDGGPVRWSDLPPMPGANRWVGPRVGPGVQVLLTTPDDEPMLVVGEYGRGRVAALAFDSTWTWRRAGRGEFHRRFWRQLILWALAREDDSDQSIDVTLSPRRFVSSEPGTFTASVPDQMTTGVPAVSLRAEVVTQSGDVVPVPLPLSNRLAGPLPELPPGFHRLRVVSVGGNPSQELTPTEVAFQVLDDTRELSDAATDHGLLRRMAAATSGSGGRVFTPEEVDELVDLIRGRRTAAEKVVIEKARLGDGPISAWCIFLVFAGSLSVEWFLRRKWGLA